MQGRVLFLATDIKALLIQLRTGMYLSSVKKQDEAWLCTVTWELVMMTDSKTENWVILVRFQVMLISHLFIVLLSQGLRRLLKNTFCKKMLDPLPLWNLINTL